jgi:phosphatidylglycerophosphatase C
LSSQVIYDFDGTITTKDTTILLLVSLLKIRPWRFFGLTWFLFRMLVASENVSKQGYKNKAIGYLLKGLNSMCLNNALKDFRNKVKFHYRSSVLSSIDKAIKDGYTVLIVTASPSFAIRDCFSDLPVIVIGTEFEKHENIYTGILKSENCYGHEKVNRLNEWATLNKTILNVQSAWTDHLSDFDMMSLAANRYWVAGKQLRKLVSQRDPEANFVDT